MLLLSKPTSGLKTASTPLNSKLPIRKINYKPGGHLPALPVGIGKFGGLRNISRRHHLQKGN